MTVQQAQLCFSRETFQPLFSLFSLSFSLRIYVTLLFFSENLCHAGPVWKRDDPRVTILHAYSHLATHWHRLNVPKVVLRSLPREKLAYFRATWVADFSSAERRNSAAWNGQNSLERFVEAEGFDDVVDTGHNPDGFLINTPPSKL